MKRIAAWLLSLGMVCGVALESHATEYQVKGVWDFLFEYTDPSWRKGASGDRFKAAQRLRTQVDMIVSPSLKGVVFFEMGDTNWGKQSDGGALGTDGKKVEVRYSYIDWVIPDTSVTVRMGLQNYTLPAFVANSPVLGGGATDGAGITVSGEFNETVGATLFWLRAENDNLGSYGNGHHASDSMDFIGMTLPIQTAAVKVVPWGIYGLLGRDSMEHPRVEEAMKFQWFRQTLLPLLPHTAQDFRALGLDRHGDSWWLGISSEAKITDGVRAAFDVSYGRVDMGTTRINGKSFAMERAGWFASAALDVQAGGMTPGLIVWYGSGDNGNAYDGSERLPVIRGGWNVTSFGWDKNFGISTPDRVGLYNDGTLGVLALLKDISFTEQLSHVVRVGWYKGTNNTAMARQTEFVSHPDGVGIENLYLTTKDSVWEVNFDTEYTMYDNLTMYLELGYLHLNLDSAVWGNRTDMYEKNNMKAALNVQYRF